MRVWLRCSLLLAVPLLRGVGSSACPERGPLRMSGFPGLGEGCLQVPWVKLLGSSMVSGHRKGMGWVSWVPRSRLSRLLRCGRRASNRAESSGRCYANVGLETPLSAVPHKVRVTRSYRATAPALKSSTGRWRARRGSLVTPLGGSRDFGELEVNSALLGLRVSGGLSVPFVLSFLIGGSSQGTGL